MSIHKVRKSKDIMREMLTKQSNFTILRQKKRLHSIAFRLWGVVLK